jgi:integrase
MRKYYYENVLANENITAKTNVAWVADITEIKLDKQKKLHIFLCVDIHSNNIIASSISRKTVTSNTIVKSLSRAIEKRFVAEPILRVIGHTDRGTQFSSQAYNNFIKHFEKFIIPSMSRENTPTDNAVAERFMRTFKEHQVGGKTFEQVTQESIISGEKPYRRILNIFIQSLNRRPNKKTLLKSPDKHDKDISAASLLMRAPRHTKAFSERYGSDRRRDEILAYKSQASEVVSVLEECAAKRSELVDKTPFDFNNNLALELIDKRLMELYVLIQSNPLVIKKYVEDAIDPTNENIQELQDELREEFETLNQKIDRLLPKAKKDRQTQPLRDPVDNNLFPIFIANAGSVFKRQKDLKQSQIRIVYTILYYCGVRINEIRHLKQEDIQKAIAASQFSLIHHKTKQAHIHVLSKKAVQDLRKLTNEFSIVFDKYNYQYLFGKLQPINEKNIIKIINKDLKHTSKKYQIPYNIKSHSFRVNMITNLLKITSVQNTANIIGHSDIRSTMIYNRYALSKNQIQDLLNKMETNTK